MNKQEDCPHNIVTPVQGDWSCQACAVPFAPVFAFEHQMDVALTALAVVVQKIAHMNGVPDGAVDDLVGAGGDRPAPGTGPRTYEADDGHVHQYHSDMAKCILCHRSPFIGG